MGSLLSYLVTYFVGGVTFIPLLIWLVWYRSPKVPSSSEGRDHLDIQKGIEEGAKRGEPVGYRSLKAGDILDAQNVGLKTYHAGWITVTKEFYKFPQINPDDFKSGAASGDMRNNTDTGTVNGNGNGSGSGSNSHENGDGAANGGLFNKLLKGGASLSGTMGEQASLDEDIKDTDGQEPEVGPTKLKQIRRRNRYYGVIKHGNLFLYSDESQKNVKHAIVLEHYFVAIWPRNLTDGQLFTKRSAICLIQKDYFIKSPQRAQDLIDLLKDGTDSSQLPKNSYFLYGDTSYEKEDWYMTLLRATYSDHPNTESSLFDALNPKVMAKPLHYYTAHMLELIDTLNSTENQLSTKWLNALAGRLFLSSYQTPEFKEAFKNKIEERLQKIRTPGFLDQLQIQRIDVGHAAPFLTNPKLKTLNPDGDMEITIDFLYQGKAMVEIATKLFINIGVGFKQRQFDIVMKVVLNRMQGELLVKVKPQPSSRLWYTFTKMPEIDLHIEPIFSSRNISYGIVTSLLQNKFKEAIKTSIVHPFFEDFVFYRSPQEIFRGGIFDRSDKMDMSTFAHVSTDQTPSVVDKVSLNGLNTIDSKEELTVPNENSDAKSSAASVKSKVSSTVLAEKETLSKISKVNSLTNDGEIHIPNKATRETETNSPDVKDTVIKSYTKLKQWYKKGQHTSNSPVASTTSTSVFSEATTELNRNGSNRTINPNNKKDTNYNPPEMITNRRRKSSKAEASPFLETAYQQESNQAASSFQLISSNVSTRPSADALKNIERKRGTSRSSRISSISSLDENSASMIQHGNPSAPSSPQMFISEKFRNYPSSHSHSNSVNVELNSGKNRNIITAPVMRFNSPTKQTTQDNFAAQSNGYASDSIDLGGLEQSPLPPLPPLPPRDLPSDTAGQFQAQASEHHQSENSEDNNHSVKVVHKRKPPPPVISELKLAEGEMNA